MSLSTARPLAPPRSPAPWIGRELYAADELAVGADRYRVEVRAFQLDPSRPAEACYCTFRLDCDGWKPVRPSGLAPGPVARRGAALVATVEGTDLSSATYGPGETIDLTQPARHDLQVT